MKLLKNNSRKNKLINELRVYIKYLENRVETLEWRIECAESNKKYYSDIEEKNIKLSKEYNEIKDKYINLLASFEILEGKMNE